MIVVGNWKMNFADPHGFCGCRGVICPPFPYIAAVRDAGCSVGAQDCSAHSDGAFTGEVSASMLASLGCEYVILGHSERDEDDVVVMAKAAKVIENGMTPVVCVSSANQSRTRGFTGCIIAYEPPGSIGTGVVCISAAVSVISEIKDGGCREVIYGGSVTDANVAEIINETGADGVIVGGASLDPVRFRAICDAVY